MEKVSHQKKSRLGAEADFLPQLERGSRISLEKQLVQAVREAIENGRLRPGMRLPSSRCLAARLQVNRNTVVNALEQLMAEEYLISKPGSGTFVNEQIHLPSGTLRSTPLSPKLHDLPLLPEPAIAPFHKEGIAFGICQPSTTNFPLAHWRKAWRQVTRHVPAPQYSDATGEPGLRAAVADYLAQARGLGCDPDDLIITNGATQGFSLVAQALLKPVQWWPLRNRAIHLHASCLNNAPPVSCWCLLIRVGCVSSTYQRDREARGWCM